MAQNDDYQSDDLTRITHDPSELADPKENLTPDEEADNDIEGVTNEEKLHEEAFGDDDEQTPIGDEITKDDVAHEQGIKPGEENKKKSDTSL
ncbi:MAG TPA: hypothetical protein VG895_02215 [Patescibacteria group bacterium]|nr:hypothetical protein [Patescibacteria group bacterium]